MDYENIIREYPEHASEVEKKYRDERKTKKASSIAYNFGNRASQDSIAFNNYMNQQLIPLQQNILLPILVIILKESKVQVDISRISVVAEY